MVGFNNRLGYFEIKPFLQGIIKANMLHEVEKGFLQSITEDFMVCTRWVYMGDVIVGKTAHCFTQFFHLEFGWIKAHRAVRCHGKLMPESRLKHTGFKQLADHFQ